MTRDDMPKLHTLPVSLTDEQNEQLRDVGIALGIDEMELLQMAAVGKIQEMFHSVQKIRNQLPLPEPDDVAGQRQRLDALQANDAVRAIMDPDYRTLMEEARERTDRMMTDLGQEDWR